MTSELVLVLTIWAEARGESEEGRAAVASVIYWRAGGKPERMAKVCLAPKQFSCWNDGALARLSGFGPSYAHSQALARIMLSGKFDPQIAATHYHAASIQPAWARGMQLVKRIGNHKFYTKCVRRPSRLGVVARDLPEFSRQAANPQSSKRQNTKGKRS